MTHQTDNVHACRLNLLKRDIFKSKNSSDCNEKVHWMLYENGAQIRIPKFECKAICLFPTKIWYNFFNTTMLESLKEPKVIFIAIVIIEAKTTVKKDKVL